MDPHEFFQRVGLDYRAAYAHGLRELYRLKRECEAADKPVPRSVLSEIYDCKRELKKAANRFEENP